MYIVRFLCLTLLLQISSSCWSQEVTPTSEAAAALKKMHQYFMSKQDLEFTSNFRMVNQGLGTTRSGNVHFILRRPNLLRVTASKGKDRIVAISDGKTLTIHNPNRRRYQTINADDSIAGNLYMVSGLLGMSMPILDFFWSVDFLATTGDRAKLKKLSARKSGSKTCDGFNVQYKDDDWSVWVERSDTLLPCYLISNRAHGSALLTLTWKPKPAITDDTFNFVAPKGHKSE
jgi:hypothetical protein